MNELGVLYYTQRDGPNRQSWGLRGMNWMQPCEWCNHWVSDHSFVLAGAPCLDCACPGYYHTPKPSPFVAVRR